MTTGRALWIIWCCGWSAFWVALAGLAWPHRACAEYLLVNPQCMQWAEQGSATLVAVFGVLAAASAAAIALPVGTRKSETPGCMRPGGLA